MRSSNSSTLELCLSPYPILYSSLDTTTKHSITTHWLNYRQHQLGKEVEWFVNNKLIPPRKEKAKAYLKKAWKQIFQNEDYENRNFVGKKKWMRKQKSKKAFPLASKKKQQAHNQVKSINQSITTHPLHSLQDFKQSIANNTALCLRSSCHTVKTH